MRIISRRSARGTLRLGGGPDTSGTPTSTTEPASESTSHASEEMHRRLALELQRRWGRDHMEAASWLLFETKARIKHWFGLHTMIPNEEWDMDRGTVSFRGLICWKCDHREWV